MEKEIKTNEKTEKKKIDNNKLKNQGGKKSLKQVEVIRQDNILNNNVDCINFSINNINKYVESASVVQTGRALALRTSVRQDIWVRNLNSDEDPSRSAYIIGNKLRIKVS